MTRLYPQALVFHARHRVEHELKWKRTEEHAPPIPNGAATDDPLAELAPLDVRLIQELGFRAFYNEETRQSDWPVPLGMSPHELALFGKDHGVLYDIPERGDIFLQRALRSRAFVHAGIVMTVNGFSDLDDRTVYYHATTIEGDTDHRGFLGRGYTCKLRRRLSASLGDRYLRWSELDADSLIAKVA